MGVRGRQKWHSGRGGRRGREERDGMGWDGWEGLNDGSRVVGRKG